MDMFALTLLFATAASASAALSSTDPAVNVQPITTKVTYADGRTETQAGLGFVVGQRFVTVNHNIAPRNPREMVEARTTYLNSIAVDPIFTNPDHDIAVFDIPYELCEEWCEPEFAVNGNIAVDVPINWPDPGNESWSAATAKELIVKGLNTARFGSCQDDLVIQVDAQFFPGSSGGPVVNEETGKAIGVVQGSFAYSDGHTAGYYKPLKCVVEMMGTVIHNRTHLAHLN